MASGSVCSLYLLNITKNPNFKLLNIITYRIIYFWKLLLAFQILNVIEKIHTL